MAREPKWCASSPGPRGSSAPNATNTTGSRVGVGGGEPRQLEHDADAARVVLGARRLGHGVEVGADDDVRLGRLPRSRGRATTLHVRPASTGTPHESPDGTCTDCRRTS